tara:strand:- start:720 stop:929 length:210 start_codon:yes stop_codon:yes gene_type:complete
MKISKHTILGQFHVLPFIKITYDKTLNGEYEFIVGWINIGISLSFKPKQRIELLKRPLKQCFIYVVMWR